MSIGVKRNEMQSWSVSDTRQYCIPQTLKTMYRSAICTGHLRIRLNKNTSAVSP